MKNNIIQIIKFIFGWPLSLLALFYLGKYLFSNGFSLTHAFSSFNIYTIIFAVISFLFYFFLRGYFWHKLLQKNEHNFSLLHSLYFWSLAELSRYIPGNIWSVVSRANVYKKSNIPIKTTVVFHVQEGIFLAIATLILSSLSISFFVYGIFTFLPFKPFFFAIALTVIATMSILFVFNKILLQKFFPVKALRTLLPNQSPKTITSLLFPMLGAFVFFGLGTYFSLASLFLLFPPDVISLVGFFIACYLVGFASFITPMGLGIREGVLAIGVSKYVNSVQKGATGALFARIVLTASELFFLGIVMAIIRIPSHIKEKVGALWRDHRYTLLLSLAIAAYIAYFTTASFLRYTNFYTGRFDLGNMDQTVWNSAHGRMFQLTDPDGTNIISRLSIHADFILVLLAPFYLLWQDPRMLLLIQTIMLSAGAIFIYYLAKEILKTKPLALVFAICFLLNPALEHSNLYDFHPVVLATTLLLGAFYFLRKKKYLFFLLFGVLAGTTKEETWAVVGLFGWYDIVANKQYLRGMFTILGGMSISYYLVDKLIPLTRGGDHFALSYYADLGSTPFGIIKTIFLSPQKVLPILFHNGRPLYLLELFAPLAFLPILSPLLLIFALPDLTINLLSNNNQLHQIYLHYTATITPFLFIAAMYSTSYMVKKFPKFTFSHVAALILVCTTISSYFYGPLFGDLHPNLDMFTAPQANKQEIEAFLNSIPRKYSVAATNNIGSHLSHRQKIYTIPIGIDTADIVVFLLTDQFAQPSLVAQEAMAQKLTTDPNYQILFKRDKVYIFAKKHAIPLLKRPTKRSFFPIFSD